jgi:hypothetical protein
MLWKTQSLPVRNGAEMCGKLHIHMLHTGRYTTVYRTVQDSSRPVHLWSYRDEIDKMSIWYLVCNTMQVVDSAVCGHLKVLGTLLQHQEV